MPELSPMERYAKTVARDSAVARRRFLNRRLGGQLVRKYLRVVPSVFTARGKLTVFELQVPAAVALGHLSQSAVLTLDSASEQLGGFRFGGGRHIYAYFENASALDALEADDIGLPVGNNLLPLVLAGQHQTLLVAVVCDELPPYNHVADYRTVTPNRLIRDFLGFYGLRRDLLVEIENKLGGWQASGPNT